MADRERLWAMNNLTQQFHDNKFPGFSMPNTIEETMHDFWNSNLPFLELPIIFNTNDSVEILKQSKEWMPVASQDFFENKSKTLGEHWFFNAHSRGWEEIRIVGCPELKKDQQYYSQIKLVPDLLPGLISQFNDNNIHFEFLSVKKLKPGGWLQPHKDYIHNNTRKFNYFWMPLNDSSDNLKIWPYGYLKHKTGRVYLFNNTGCVHSVLNRDSIERYVVLGRFDLSKTQFKFNTAEEVEKQWYS